MKVKCDLPAGSSSCNLDPRPARSRTATPRREASAGALARRGARSMGAESLACSRPDLARAWLDHHVPCRVLEWGEAEPLVEPVRIECHQRPAPEALELWMRERALHRPIAETAAAMVCDDEYVAQHCRRRAVGDHPSEAAFHPRGHKARSRPSARAPARAHLAGCQSPSRTRAETRGRRRSRVARPPC
jgi:hypothetical protein